MPINKSDLIKELSNNFPNFLKRDLIKATNIIFNNIKYALKKNERVELRDIFMFEAKRYRSKFARNPKTNEKIFVPEKKIIRFKVPKKWQKDINEKT